MIPVLRGRHGCHTAACRSGPARRGDGPGDVVIICHCRVVSDDAVYQARAEGARTVGQVCRATGAGRDCGSCVFTVKRLLCEHEAFAPSVVEVPAVERPAVERHSAAS